MKLQTIITLALAVTLGSTGAMAQKAKKTSKKSARKAQPAATLTPALKAVDGKTFSYALGVAQGESLKQYLVSQLGVDSAYVPEAIRAMTTNISPEERKKAEAREKLPETVAALQEDNKTLKEENAMLKQCLMEMSEIVYA